MGGLREGPNWVVVLYGSLGMLAARFLVEAATDWQAYIWVKERVPHMAYSVWPAAWGVDGQRRGQG